MLILNGSWGGSNVVLPKSMSLLPTPALVSLPFQLAAYARRDPEFSTTAQSIHLMGEMRPSLGEWITSWFSLLVFTCLKLSMGCAIWSEQILAPTSYSSIGKVWIFKVQFLDGL